MHFVVADGEKKTEKKTEKTDCKTYMHSRHLEAWMRKKVNLLHFPINCFAAVKLSLFVRNFVCVGYDSDIQEYYEVTLLDDQKSLQQKTAETNQVASRWDRPSTTANSVIQPPQVI